jgi:hypothetical protein
MINLDVVGMGKDLNVVLHSMKIVNRLIQHGKYGLITGMFAVS